MSARYVYRLDDVTATMHWGAFRRFMALFREYGVVPLLGVVPDNRDPKLEVGPAKPGFWEIVRALRDEGLVEIAQHGYEHRYVTRNGGLLGPRFGFPEQSEFAGLPYEAQREKLARGKAILERHGLGTDVFMAPSHSFDRTTLSALVDSGFRYVTDGVGLYPERRHGLVFVPQQLWAPRRLPLGVWTICLHLNHADDSLYKAVERHLRSGAVVVAFGVAARSASRGVWRLINAMFRPCYAVAAAWRRRARSGKSS